MTSHPYPEEKIHTYLEYHDSLDKIRDLVLIKLVDCGWRDEVRLAIKKIIIEKDGGVTVPTVDDILSKIQMKARTMMPDSVKKEMVHELETICINIDKLAKKPQ